MFILDISVLRAIPRSQLELLHKKDRIGVEAALCANAAAVIFAHNALSGVAQPCQADEHLTRNLKDALACSGFACAGRVRAYSAVASIGNRRDFEK